MAYQPIGLGTPNNNDGDSLYVGGVKINSNFAELYAALAGSSSAALKINVGSTTPGTSTVLTWNRTLGQFVPASSNVIRTNGVVGSSVLYITNSQGISGGADGNIGTTGTLTSTAVLALEGRTMLSISPRGTVTSVAGMRGALNINVGNSNVTSLSVYTTGVVIRGLSGLEIYEASAEDTATYTKLLDNTSTATGLTLYQTPSLNIATMSAGVRTGSDSSAAICHTGFVKLLLAQYPNSSRTVRGVRGIISNNSSNNLTANSEFNIDGIYHPKHCEGLIYNYNTIDNKITLVTGAAAHWSYSTSGVASIIPTTSIAIVASYTPIIRTFAAGWVPDYNDVGSTNAVIDATITQNSWYYLYYLGCLTQHTNGSKTFYPGSSNVVVSSNRDIASVDAQLAAAGYGGLWQVVRRLGPVRTDAQASPRIVPFNVKRIDHGAYEYYWGLTPNGWGVASGADSSYTTVISASSLAVKTSSQSFTLANYNSAVLTTIPPIPGITAHITIKHKPTSSIPALYLYGDSWTVNSSISALYPPFELIRSMDSGLTCVHNISLPMIPDGCYIPDGTYNGAGLLSITTSTGLRIRYMFQTMDGFAATTSQALSFTVTGFRLAR